ncbi:hypothetical protein [Candidatus Enterococcus leclercqii]|uniref:hypothetical protein n=1 Tax=Candidatus Enterococcus leclercqii TaxID=1857218 RepID=UPI00137AEE6C|nr:hypothetical protein [Enterococcus sp. CU9D]KAF1291370.1 hypothetical protein BAU14_00575 [Enterococcus sp. CU9D]
MRKIKWQVAGSRREGRYLTKMLSEGYVLESTSRGFYQFKVISDPQQYQLIREFSDQPIDQENKTALIELGLAAITQRRLPGPGQAYYLVYSYPLALPDEKAKANNDDGFSDISGDFAIERAYRQRQVDKRRFIQTGFAFLLACCWGLSLIPGLSETLAVFFLLAPLLLIPLVWLAPFVATTSARRRLRQLKSQNSDYQSSWLPTLTVTLHSQRQVPLMEKLTYIGTWRLINQQKKNGTATYIYQLKSLMSEDDIKAAIQEMLQIPETEIRIVTSWGLYGIGGMF